MSRHDRSHESGGRSTRSAGSMGKKPAGQATSAARLSPSAALSRVSNTRLQQHTRRLAGISQCVADAAAVILSYAFPQFARAAASTVAGKTVPQLTRLFVRHSRRTVLLLRHCKATSTGTALFPCLRLLSFPDAAASSSRCSVTHTTGGFAAGARRRAFPSLLNSLLFLLSLLLLLLLLLLLPPSLTPHAPLLSHHPSTLSPCRRHPLFNSSSSSSRASVFSSASCSPSLFSPNFFFAAAAATGAGQRVVSPVPPVAVEGRDEHTLPSFAALREAASTADFSTWLQKVRRELHSWPELMFQEHRTSALVQLALQTLQIPFTKGWGSDTEGLSAAAAEQQRAAKRGTGVVAHVGTGAEPCIVLRADMDALPILEKTDVPFRSKRDNIMHACGHDVHTTLLLGAAALLKAVEPQLKGTVRLIFQPAEEGGAGGKFMREEGVLRLFPPAQLVFGHHLEPELPTGVLATRAGVLYAAVTNFTIQIEGKGGHAAAPLTAIDAGPAVAALLQAIYAIGSREVSVDTEHAGLITVTQIHGGTALNVIPPKYELGGTIRALHPATQTRLEARLQEAAQNTAAAFRCTCHVHLHPRKYPPLINDPKATELYRQIMAEASASGKVEEARLRMGGEDFAFFLQETPGVYAVIGSGSGAEVPGQPRSDFPPHSDYFAVDERVLSYGAALEAHLALQALEHLKKEATAEGEREAAAVEAAAGAQAIAAAAAVQAVVGQSAGAAAEGGARAAGREADGDSTVTKKKTAKDSTAAAGARTAAEVTGEANEEEESGGRENHHGEEGGTHAKAKRVNSAAPKEIRSDAEEL